MWGSSYSGDLTDFIYMNILKNIISHFKGSRRGRPFTLQSAHSWLLGTQKWTCLEEVRV